MPESERVKWFQEQARVTPPDADGVQYVEVFGLPIGKFRQPPDTGNWQYQWLSRDGFVGGWTELRPAQDEHVEHWAVTEIARNIDWDEQDRQGG
jgi:hypothetical protein